MHTRVIARQLLLLKGVFRLAFVSVLLHAALTPISRTQAAPALDGEEAELLRLINEYRGQNGAPALQASATLTSAAAWHASDMAQRNYFSHIDSFGRNPFVRFAAFGYNYQTTKSETIAAGYTTAAETFNAWRNSSGHNAVMLNPAFRAIGIGRVLNSASTWQIYWSAGYGGLLDQPVSPAPPPAPIPPPAPSPNDTTGVYRPLDGTLYLRFTNTSGYADVAIPYGMPGDYPVTGDWDGDGVDTIGIYRGGAFFLRNSNTAGYAEVMLSFGQNGDLPVAGDWDGDGKATVGVFRGGQFLLRNSLTAGPPDWAFSFGLAGDLPVTGDWDGDGVDTVGVYRSATATFFLRNANNAGAADLAVNYGAPGDLPMAGDWDGDGVATVGIYRQGLVALRNSNTGGYAELAFLLGTAGDVPLAGRWQP